MIVKCLIENHQATENLISEHGLSLYIETRNHRILFDFGASDGFAKNAKEMNVDLSKVDLAVLSHGHYDHGGGLGCFLNVNNTAQVYVNYMAFEDHYSERIESEFTNISISKAYVGHDQIHYVGSSYEIDSELTLFSDVSGEIFVPKGNQAMWVKNGSNNLFPDVFLHEQNLLVKEESQIVLFSGCAHKGIINIVMRAAEYMGRMPDVVIGGFHLTSKRAEYSETTETIKEMGKILLNTGVKYYTCHCTGDKAYTILSEVMGSQVSSLSTGETININD